MEQAAVAEVVSLPPRSSGRAHPVTPWRAAFAGLVNEVVKTISENEDPERQFLLARETAEDITYAIKTRLREQYGRVFDPLHDKDIA